MATNKLITVQQLDSAVDGFASAVAAAGYEKKANLKALAYVDEIADTHLASSITTVLAAKMTTARAQELVDKNVGKAYKPGGNATLATLPAADAAHFGYVYNMTEEFTTTDNFIEGAGKIFTAGSEVAIVEVEGSDPTVYKYNVLSGYIDTTKFAAQSSFATVKAAVENLSIATNSDIQALIDGLSLEDVAAVPSLTLNAGDEMRFNVVFADGENNHIDNTSLSQYPNEQSDKVMIEIFKDGNVHESLPFEYWGDNGEGTGTLTGWMINNEINGVSIDGKGVDAVEAGTYTINAELVQNASQGTTYTVGISADAATNTFNITISPAA